jgi:hypothetical protein
MGARRIAILQGAKAFALAFMLFSIAIAIASQNKPEAADARMERVVSGLRPPIAIKGQAPVRWKLTEEMAEGHVPGMSSRGAHVSRFSGRGLSICCEFAPVLSPSTPHTV